jgi:hypothetical protein
MAKKKAEAIAICILLGGLAARAGIPIVAFTIREKPHCKARIPKVW